MARESIKFDISLIQENTHLEASYETVRILMVISGECKVNYNEEEYSLNKSDYLLINAFEEAEVSVRTGSYIVMISAPYDDLLKGTGDHMVMFRCCSKDGRGSAWAEMHHILTGLVMCHTGDDSKNRFQAVGLYYLMLQGLINNFRITEKKDNETNESSDKTGEIIRYVLLNYKRDISSTEIASRFYMSRSTVSRMIKRYTGDNFPDFIKKLRLRVVVKELTTTQDSMTKIAMDSGFSSLSVMNRTFREYYGMSPSEYRQKNESQEKVKADDRLSEKKVYDILMRDLENEDKETERTTDYPVIYADIDVRNETPWEGWKNRLLNVGSVNAVRSARIQQQVITLQERLNIEYVRIWNPFFSPELMVLGEGTRGYNFSVIDEALDFLTDRRLKVFIDFTPRRERTMANAHRELTGKPNEIIFRTRTDWENILRAFLSHVLDRYQIFTVKDWIFEFSFFLNDIPYYKENYHPWELWETSARLVKTFIPGARVAGPGLIPESDPETDANNIKMFVERSQPKPDIFTALHFPYFGNRSEIYNGPYKRNPSRQYLKTESDIIRRTLRQLNFHGEYWVTDWGISISDRNFLQDSCYRAVAIIEGFLQTRANVDAMGVFYASDLISVFSDTTAVLAGSGGILSRNGSRKPAYYAWRFLHQLGSRLLFENGDCIATSNGPSDIRVLCWNKKNTSPSYFLQEEDACPPDRVEELLENTDPETIIFSVTGLEKGQRYRIRQRILNKEKGSVLDKWVHLGADDSLSRDDLEYLSQASVPEIIAEIRDIREDGAMNLEVTLTANEIRMIHINRI